MLRSSIRLLRVAALAVPLLLWSVSPTLAAGHGGGHGGGGHGGGGHGGGFHGGGHGGGFHGGGGHGGYYHGGHYHGGYGHYRGYGYGPFVGLYGYGYPYNWDSYPYYYSYPSSVTVETAPYVDYYYTPPATIETQNYYLNGAAVPGGTAPVPAVTTNAAALVSVHVPANAQVWFDDSLTTQTGEWRTYTTPALDAGRAFFYNVRARWTDPQGRVVEQTRRVEVRAGQRENVDFLSAAPSGS